MAPAILVAFQVISYLAANKDTIKQSIMDIEALIPSAPGNDKASALKGFIAGAVGVEAQIEAAWPFIAPIFNLFVASIKKPVAV